MVQKKTGEKNEFGKWLEKRRTNDGMTIREQAELIGISPTVLCGFACGARPITEKTINRIISAYEMDSEQQREFYATVITSEEIARAEKAADLLKKNKMTAIELAVWIKYGV